MKEVKKCSISGVAFTMDQDAYQTLDDYLESLKNTYFETADGPEIVADIEARIAELILSVQDNARVVEKPLVDNIIAQMGSVEQIGEQSDTMVNGEPRIPRRLYRDTENGRLGGVCAGIGRYFDMDPVWVRLGIFLPLILSLLKWIPFLDWTGRMMGNVFGIFVVCYLIMWFAVPAARTARQKLEMSGERITVRSIRETTVAANDVDGRAKSVVADVVSAVGQVVLILLKILAGIIVFGLIMGVCGLIIGLLAVIVGGEGLFTPGNMGDLVSPWLVSLGIIVALIPMILLIYVFMCLIASRKPGGRSVLIFFLLWIMSIIALSGVAIRENAAKNFFGKRSAIERVMSTEVTIDSDTTSLGRLLREHAEEIESVLETNPSRLHISVPDKKIEITINRDSSKLTVTGQGVINED